MWSPTTLWTTAWAVLLAFPLIHAQVQSTTSLACTQTPSPLLPSCPLNNATSISDSCGTEYSIFCGLEALPGSGSIYPVTTLDSCAHLCDQQATCRAASFNGTSCRLETADFAGLNTSSNTFLKTLVKTPVCPHDDGLVLNGTAGFTYEIGCGADTLFGNFQQVKVNGRFAQCFEYCDTLKTSQSLGHCTAFTYQGGENGDGPGICFFKAFAGERFDRGIGLNYVGVIRRGAGGDQVPTGAGTSGGSATTGSVASVTPAIACPYANETLQANGNGQNYTVWCSADTTDGAYTQVDVKNGFNDCFPTCDDSLATDGTTKCTSFTFVGGPNGQEEGSCFLKDGVIVSPIYNLHSDYVGAARQGYDGDAVTLASSTADAPASSVSTSIASSPTGLQASCPADNGATFTDNSGISYSVCCSADTDDNAFAQSRATYSFNDCIEACDNTPGCTAFTYIGGHNGRGSGTCYLKNFADGHCSSSPNDFLVSGIRAGHVASPLTQTATPTSSASACDAPKSTGLALTCPDAHGNVSPGSEGNSYEICCGCDTPAPLTSQSYACNSWPQCLEFCDSANNSTSGSCTGFTFVSLSATSRGAGICYLKSDSHDSFVERGNNYVAAIRILPGSSSLPVPRISSTFRSYHGASSVLTSSATELTSHTSSNAGTTSGIFSSLSLSIFYLASFAPIPYFPCLSIFRGHPWELTVAGNTSGVVLLGLLAFGFRCGFSLSRPKHGIPRMVYHVCVYGRTLSALILFFGLLSAVDAQTSSLSIDASSSSSPSLSPSSTVAPSSSTLSTSVITSTSTVVYTAGADGFTTVPWGSGSPACTAINSNIYVVIEPSYNKEWVFICGSGTGGQAVGVNVYQSNWTLCLAGCSGTGQCVGFSYNNGGPYGVANAQASGSCTYKALRSSTIAFSSTGDPASTTNQLVTTRVGAIMRQVIFPTTSSAILSSSSTSAAPSTTASSTSVAPTTTAASASSSAASSSAPASASASVTSISSSTLPSTSSLSVGSGSSSLSSASSNIFSSSISTAAISSSTASTASGSASNPVSTSAASSASSVATGGSVSSLPTVSSSSATASSSSSLPISSSISTVSSTNSNAASSSISSSLSTVSSSAILT
ncbi:hypothetical protein K431DRAFT_312364, partial [Polychaeton citri CBS 116435]